MRIIVITLAILMAGCSNYDSCYDKNFKAFYEAHEGEIDYVAVLTAEEADPTPPGVPELRELHGIVPFTKKQWVQWDEGKRKWKADQYASGQCRNIN